MVNAVTSLPIVSLKRLDKRASRSERAPLVFLHGWGNNSLAWQLLVEQLDVHFECYGIDLPAFGENETDCFDLDTVVGSIIEVLPARCHLIGWSLGGMIAAKITRRCSEKIISLITIASNAKFSRIADEKGQWTTAGDPGIFKKFYKGFRVDPTSTFTRFTQLQAQGDTSRKAVLQFLRAQQEVPTDRQKDQWLAALKWLDDIDNRELLKALKVPHFSIFGENDTLVPHEVAHQMLKFGMSSKSWVVKRAGHVPHVSQAEALGRSIEQFTHGVENPFVLDKQKVARSFSAAAPTYDSMAVLQKIVADKLLTLLPNQGVKIADLGCGTGYCSGKLTQFFDVIGLDIAQGMLNQCRENNPAIEHQLICADVESLPFENASLDGMFSSLSIQWCENIDQLFSEFKRVLKPGGWLLFSTLGPETLFELRDAWKKVDAYTHINRFDEQSTVNEALLTAGFAIEKTMLEKEVMEYQSVMDLMRSLKGIGAHNVNAGQSAGLTTRKKIHALENAYESYRSQGVLPASYEVYYYLAYIN